MFRSTNALSRNWLVSLKIESDVSASRLFFLGRQHGIQYAVWQVEKSLVLDATIGSIIVCYIQFEHPTTLKMIQRQLPGKVQAEVAQASWKEYHSYCTKPFARIDGSWYLGYPREVMFMLPYRHEDSHSRDPFNRISISTYNDNENNSTFPREVVSQPEPNNNCFVEIEKID